MVSITAVYQAVLVVAGVACLGIAVYAWRMESTRGQRELIGLFLAIDGWIVLALLTTLFAGTPIARTIIKTQFFGMTLVPVFALLAALQYTGRDQYINGWLGAFLAVQPVVVGVAMQFPSVARQAFRFGAVDPSAFYGYQVTYGWFLYANVIWAYLLLAMATGLFLEFAVRADPVYQRQATAIVIGIAAPWAGNALFLLGPAPVDLTALGFVVTGLAIWWAIYADDLLDVMPVAKSTVIENIDAGVLVLNWQDRVVDLNPRGRDLLGLAGVDVVGREGVEVLSDVPQVRDAVGEVTEVVQRTESEVRARGRDLRVTATTLNDSYGRRLGRLVLIEDITEQKRRQRELQRQNERLDEFAGVVSHDLRNPLSVASGELELAMIASEGGIDDLDDARERIDEMRAHVASASSSLERMDAIVDDVLALARGGQQVQTTEDLSLRALAERAWANVDAPEAALSVESDTAITGDGDRLQRVFENLFRNAVEHGSTGNRNAERSGDVAEETSAGHRTSSDDALEHGSTSNRTPSDDAIEHGDPAVTVTVGELGERDGFYVADDGKGIPDDERDAVFESEYTTDDDGTGFGLAIVEEIVEAHDWTITATESENGGARFDIEGAR
ncbi:histidine kinase N-terminal 7TM domain-containing protein [Halorientalis pallida]|uniref:histidine kinase N-terminal 7TM domain-containing protein n=1 Tax=Halorientalis pallida TaxID=2479928 RepID=UPI003C6ECB5F